MSDYYSWVRTVWVNSKGQPLSFKKRKYLVQIYTDQHPNIVYVKPSQMGLSERGVSESTWLADQKSLNTLYTFPAEKQLREFVQARVNSVYGMSDYLASKVEDVTGKSVETLGLKRIGNGYIYFRGSQNEKQIITIDADMVILDERDRFDERSVPFIDKRLNASPLKWRREISTPTVPDVGIDVSYHNSDMRVWEVPCQHCGLWQELDFFKNVDFKKKIAVCIGCHKKIKRFVDGRWRATNPKSKVHGYKISGMYNPMMTIESMVTKYKKASKAGFAALQQFYNQDLGQPYEIVGQGIQVSDLNECKRTYGIPVSINKTNNTYAGADVGVKYIHCVVVEKVDDEKYKLIWAGTIPNFEGPSDSLEAIMNKYRIKKLVVDEKPEVKKVKEFIDKFTGRVYAADYSNTKFSVQEYMRWDDIKYEVKLDRTISLDYLVSDIYNQRLELPDNIEMVENFYDHLKAVRRVTDKNRVGSDVAKWIERGPDHYLHALNYARIAQSRGTVGKALLDYYKEPQEGLTSSLLSWIRINAQRIH